MNPKLSHEEIQVAGGKKHKRQFTGKLSTGTSYRNDVFLYPACLHCLLTLHRCQRVND